MRDRGISGFLTRPGLLLLTASFTVPFSTVELKEFSKRGRDGVRNDY